MRFIWLLIRYLLASIIFVCLTLEAWAEEESEIDKLGDAVVVVSGEEDTPIWGAGIVFARTQDEAYIVTANHVVRRGTKEVRNLRVKFRYWPDKTLVANLLDKFDPDLDVAVLRVTGLKKQGIDCSTFPVDVLTNTKLMKRGDLVTPIGNPNGMPWIIPAQGESVAKAAGTEITFQSTLISPGHSGGALIGNQESTDFRSIIHRGIVGMITKDQPPYGMAIDIWTIGKRLQDWGYPFQLVEPYPIGEIYYEKALPTSFFLHGFIADRIAGGSWYRKLSVKDTIREMLDKDPCLVNARGTSSYPLMNGRISSSTPLVTALYGWISVENKKAIIELLLQAGANPNFTYPGNPLPMEMAKMHVARPPNSYTPEARALDIDILKLLREYGNVK